MKNRHAPFWNAPGILFVVLEPTGDVGSFRQARIFAQLPFLLVILLWLIILFHGVIWGGETFYRRDLYALHQPARKVLVEISKPSGAVPSWNPYYAEGQPFAANPQNGVFHPLTWLFYLQGFHVAFTAQVLVPILFTLLAMRCFLRQLGCSQEAAWIGACAWGLGGFVLSISDLLPVLFSTAPLPWLLSSCHCWWISRKPASLLSLAASFAFVCMGGEPATLIVAAILLLMIVLHASHATGERNEDRAPHRLMSKLFALGGALILGSAIAAIVLLPAYRLRGKTIRSETIPSEKAGLWSLPPERTVEFALPFLFSNPQVGDVNDYWSRGFPGPRITPLVGLLYIGLFPFVLAVTAVIRNRGESLIWLIVAGSGFLLAAGRFLPFWGIVRAVIPVFGTLRFPERFMVLTCFALPVLCALGFDTLFQKSERTWTHLKLLAAVIATTSAVLALGSFFLLRLNKESLFRFLGLEGQRAESFALHFPLSSALHALVGVVVVLACSFLGKQPKRVIGAMILAITATDLALYCHRFVATFTAGALDTPPPFLIPLVNRPSPTRLFHLAEWAGPCLEKSDFNSLARPPIPARWLIPLALESDFDLLQLSYSHNAPTAILNLATKQPDLLIPMLARRGISVILRCPASAQPKGNELSADTGPPHVELFSVPNPAPSTFCAPVMETVADDQQWAAAVQRLGAASARAVILHNMSLAEIPPQGISPCTVRIVASSPNQLALDVSAEGPQPSLVAINQTWDEDWQLTVDQQPAHLLRADLSLTAVTVPPGQHRVELKHYDPSINLGMIVSFAGLALWVLGGAIIFIMSRRQVKENP